MRWLLFLFLLSHPALAAGSLEYDLEHPYANPLAGAYQGCQATVDFYQVYRPLMPLVTHTFIGADVHGTCDGKDFRTLQIYGASKGAGDLALFTKLLATNNSPLLEALGTSSGEDSYQALETATKVSLDWQARLKNPAYFYPRLIVTPIAGRPCAVSAHQIRVDIKPFLVR